MELQPPAKINFNSEIAYFIGVLQGDGNINKVFDKNGWATGLGLRIAVGYKDKSYTKLLKKLIKKELKYTPYIKNAEL